MESKRKIQFYSHYFPSKFNKAKGHIEKEAFTRMINSQKSTFNKRIGKRAFPENNNNINKRKRFDRKVINHFNRYYGRFLNLGRVNKFNQRFVIYYDQITI